MKQFITAIIALKDFYQLAIKGWSILTKYLERARNKKKQKKLSESLNDNNTKKAEDALNFDNPGEPSNDPGVQRRTREDKS